MRTCECGNTFDPISDYQTIYDILDGEYSLEDFFPDMGERIMCSDCAIEYIEVTAPAGEAYEWSLETGRDPAEYYRA